MTKQRFRNFFFEFKNFNEKKYRLRELFNARLHDAKISEIYNQAWFSLLKQFAGVRRMSVGIRCDELSQT